jgi:hypothetical protein
LGVNLGRGVVGYIIGGGGGLSNVSISRTEVLIFEDSQPIKNNKNIKYKLRIFI